PLVTIVYDWAGNSASDSVIITVLPSQTTTTTTPTETSTTGTTGTTTSETTSTTAGTILGM
ncbi:MAG: hypothetical protein ACTSYX_01755, partial [Candidatus Thorarchaeota archaeon]